MENITKKDTENTYFKKIDKGRICIKNGDMGIAIYNI